MSRISILSAASISMLAACSFVFGESVLLDEVFFTTDQARENIDSPAVWHGEKGQHWLLATSKEGHSVNVFDGMNGRMLRRIGGQGVELGQFDRPNGIWVIDDLVFVVERDNQRVQVLSLPSMIPLISFGQEVLTKPYGIYVRELGEGTYEVYVTDNYETKSGDVPPDLELGRRVHRFLVMSEGATAEAKWVTAFGETSGRGRLFVVESIYGDPVHDRLLVADELEDTELGRSVKVYDMEGRYTGINFGEGVFYSQVEGIALYPISETEGFWIVTDQSKVENFFHVFDRVSLQHLGSFQGRYTLNTDGVWASRQATERYPEGLFYACDNDRGISVFDFAEIFDALGIER